MIGNNGDKDDIDFEEVDETLTEETLEVEPSATEEILDIGGDTMVDITAEVKVDELVAKLDASDPDEVAHQREVRRRLEELREEKDSDLDSTFNFNMDEDI
ncbi:MAG: hypothetical protein OER91_00665 [Gammaproteobacteria bacterium]|nr:hypothetical protein [Gammaproteobacteria bacterium]